MQNTQTPAATPDSAQYDDYVSLDLCEDDVHEFEFRVYSPTYFASIRKLAKISEKQFFESVCARKHSACLEVKSDLLVSQFR